VNVFGHRSHFRKQHYEQSKPRAQATESFEPSLRPFEGSGPAPVIGSKPDVVINSRNEASRLELALALTKF